MHTVMRGIMGACAVALAAGCSGAGSAPASSSTAACDQLHAKLTNLSVPDDQEIGTLRSNLRSAAEAVTRAADVSTDSAFRDTADHVVSRLEQSIEHLSEDDENAPAVPYSVRDARADLSRFCPLL